MWVVGAGPDAIKRGDKLRASVLTFVREATEEETRAAIERFSTVFGAHAAAMAEEQCAWRRALGRPQHDAAVVERALAAALASRGLAWSLQRYDTAWAAWAPRAPAAALARAGAAPAQEQPRRPARRPDPADPEGTLGVARVIPAGGALV